MTAYREVIDQSHYSTIKGVADDYGLSYGSLQKWVRGDCHPRPENQQKLEEVMSDLRTKPRMEKHPSYGWAFPHQIERLQQIGIGPERDRIMGDIAKQNKLAGKLK